MMTTKPEKPRQRRVSLARRLADAARTVSADGCWLWQGPCGHSSGYPRMSFRCPHRGRLVSMSVHRGLIERKLSRPLARSEYVLHRPHCPKHCVNPAHLRVGTHAENMADAKVAGRIGRRKMQPWQVRWVLDLHERGRVPRRKIAELFGCQPQTIEAIVTGRTHSKVTGIKRPAARNQPAQPLWLLTLPAIPGVRGETTYRVPAWLTDVIAGRARLAGPVKLARPVKLKGDMAQSGPSHNG